MGDTIRPTHSSTQTSSRLCYHVQWQMRGGQVVHQRSISTLNTWCEWSYRLKSCGENTAGRRRREPEENFIDTSSIFLKSSVERNTAETLAHWAATNFISFSLPQRYQHVKLHGHSEGTRHIAWRPFKSWRHDAGLRHQAQLYSSVICRLFCLLQESLS